MRNRKAIPGDFGVPARMRARRGDVGSGGSASGMWRWCPCPIQHSATTPVPQWHLDEVPYVKQGFRVGYTPTMALLSLFGWHNQTINIWTHLIPGILGVYFLAKQLPQLDDSLDVCFSIFYASSAFMFLTSTAYHTFQCVGARVAERLLKLDLLGITIMISGSYFPGIFIGFRCNPVWRIVWLSGAILILLVGASVAFNLLPQRHSTVALCILVGVGVVPAVHWIVLTHRMAPHALMVLGPGLLGMFTWYGVGAIIFCSRWPECRYCTGNLGASHQMWHLCVCFAAGSWWWTCEAQRQMLRQGELGSCL